MPPGLRRRIRSETRATLIATLRGAKTQMRAVVEAEADAIKREFEDVVSDWSDKNRPSFTRTVTVTREEIRAEVRPYKRRRASKVFEYVDLGTPPHTIRPRRAGGRLAFMAGVYSPKTLPVAQAHVGTGRVEGGHLVRPTEVNHPGTEARLFSETIHDRRTKQFRRAVENLFRLLERQARRATRSK